MPISGSNEIQEIFRIPISGSNEILEIFRIRIAKVYEMPFSEHLFHKSTSSVNKMSLALWNFINQLANIYKTLYQIYHLSKL